MGLRGWIWALDARGDHVPPQLLTKYARAFWEINSQILANSRLKPRIPGTSRGFFLLARPAPRILVQLSPPARIIARFYVMGGTFAQSPVGRQGSPPSGLLPLRSRWPQRSAPFPPGKELVSAFGFQVSEFPQLRPRPVFHPGLPSARCLPENQHHSPLDTTARTWHGRAMLGDAQN